MTLASLHPLVVHFTIVLIIVGVAFKLVSLFGRPAFAGPTATTLLLLGAVSAFVSAQSGTAAHGPVERAPGARPPVMEHEEWGERTNQIMMGVGVLELAGLVLRRWPKVKIVHAVSAVVGVAAVVAVYEAAEHGGDLVYNYAGGVGLRSGDPKDVERLLLMGYYQQAMADRKAGRTADAAELIAAAAKRFPSDPEVQMLAGESMLVDLKNPQGALDTLTSIKVPADNRFMLMRHATLQADAYEAAGQKDKAAATLEAVVKQFPNPRLQQRIDALKRGATPSTN
ncbi:MAG TPA: DUF2231 domain-containing protein [Vicinamibacterales bacterium]|nr:DUF2231 domain-containing protein [Vicinamibacterales bacterium]